MEVSALGTMNSLTLSIPSVGALQPNFTLLKFRVMKLSWMLVVCSLIASYCISQTPSYQKKILAGENAFVAYARKHLLEISSSDSATNDLDLLPLLQMIGKSNVLALGEPSHGSHEPLAFRNRLFRFLVEKGGFTAIVIECGMAQSRDANIYVTGGPGSATDAARKLSIAGPSPETVALLEWMRSYNANPDHIVKIHFYGMDVSLVGFPGDTARSHAAIDEVLHYLGKADKSAAARLGKAMKPWLPRISVKNYSLLTPAEHTRLSGLIDEMWTVLKKKKKQYIQSTSPAEFE
jgi:erythromycin esterase